MSSVVEMVVEAEIEKINCFVKNGIFNLSDRTEHSPSPPIYHTSIFEYINDGEAIAKIHLCQP